MLASNCCTFSKRIRRNPVVHPGVPQIPERERRSKRVEKTSGSKIKLRNPESRREKKVVRSSDQVGKLTGKEGGARGGDRSGAVKLAKKRNINIGRS